MTTTTPTATTTTDTTEPLPIRIEQLTLLVRVAGSDRLRFDDPDADALLATGIDVTRHFQRLGGVGGVQAAAVLVFETLLAANENFPERPFFQLGSHADSSSNIVCVLPPVDGSLAAFAVGRIPAVRGPCFLLTRPP